MEGTRDTDAIFADLVKNLDLSAKENNQFLQLDNSNVIGTPLVSIPPENDLVESNSSLRLPKGLSETLKCKSSLQQTMLNAQAGWPITSSSTLDGSKVTVEELTSNSYNFPNLLAIGCSNRHEQLSTSKGKLKHLYHSSDCHKFKGSPIVAECNEPLASSGGDENTRSMWLSKFSFQDNHLNKHVDKDYCGIYEHLNYKSHTVSSTFTSVRGERLTKAISGFSQFFVKNTLKEKDVVNRHVQTCENLEIVNLDNDRVMPGIKGESCKRVMGYFGKPEDLNAYIESKGGGNSGDCGINLQELLQPGSHKINKAQSLHIFKQIVALVDFAHSQGVPLNDLRPSYFMIFSSDRVEYVGSLALEIDKGLSESSIDQEGNYLGQPLKRKKCTQDVVWTTNLPRKQQKVAGNSKIMAQHPKVGSGCSKTELTLGEDINCLRLHTSDYGSSKKWALYKGNKMGNASSLQNPELSSGGKGNKMGNVSGSLSESQSPELTCERNKLEDRWYTSPESINDRICTLESNIYALGVLLFELFCSFKSREVHIEAMSDLHHRILPPYFLSENPKVAGFCVWMLHPKPSLRPKSREILKSGLCEGQDVSPVDQSSSAVSGHDGEPELLLHFLLSLKKEKEKLAAKLVEKIEYLESDIKEVKKRHCSRTELLSQTHQALNSKSAPSSCHVIFDEGHYYGPLEAEVPSRVAKSCIDQAKLVKDVKELQNLYFSVRSRIVMPETGTSARSDRDVLCNGNNLSSVHNDSDLCTNDSPTDRLGSFFDGVCKYARHTKFEVAGILRSGDLLNSVNVVCSLSFDRDEEYFAAAGISKKIKIFDFGSLLNESVDVHYPVVEMSSKSKLSFLCWNNYIKNYLASTDYDGVIQLWDAGTGQGFSQYKEHQKRAWSVDFSQVDPIKFASGSDDCSVKLWSINEVNCISTIRNAANVCCVQFSSHSSHLLSFGSADYKIYCYDLRSTRIPWCILGGHGKAVSYVKFLDASTLVSASTDNTLKIWDLNKTASGGVSTDACRLTLSGHKNEKNFVGLSISDGYIACGSETNEVYTYYKSLPMPVTCYKFGFIDPISGHETVDDNGQFVSSVCWRQKSNMLIAANSIGYIKLLRMV